MQLFNNLVDPDKNLLPFDGTVNYYGPIMDEATSNQYLHNLLEKISWQHDTAIIFGRHITTKRKVAWYGNEAYDYTYSKTTRKALEWTPDLVKLKSLVEKKTDEQFNSCLLNLYHSGEEGMAWHCDEERELKKNGAIASLSFGAERKFALKHKENKEKVSLMLEHGSLLVMKGTTQTHWLHCLPKTKKVTMPRVNLTFRTIHN